MAVLFINSDGLYSLEQINNTPSLISGSITALVAVHWWPLGQWGTILTYRATDKDPVFIGRGTLVGTTYTPDREGNYVATTLTSQIKFGTGYHCACGHQRRALISHYNVIYYSDEQGSAGAAEGFITGYDNNYVNVGNGEDTITGMYESGGNLVVLMRNSIWLKMGEESELVAENFRRVLVGCGSHPHVNCIHDGIIYFGNNNGLYQFTGQSAIELTEPIASYWRANYDADESWVKVWDYKKWLMVKPSSSADLLVYDLKKRIWFPENHFNPACLFGSPIGEKWCLMFKDLPEESYYNLFNLAQTVAGADTVAQVVRIPGTVVTHPHKRIRVSRIHLDATGVTQLLVYARNGPASAWTLKHTENNPLPWTVLDNWTCKEVSWKVIGTGEMIFRSSAIEIMQENY